MNYAKIGNGPKNMVILPGIALHSCVGAADAIAQAFASFQDFTIYLIDDRDNVDAAYNLKKRADDVAALLKSLSVRDAYVYGASMGGMVTMQLAIHYPELVKKIVVASSCARLNERSKELTGLWERLAHPEQLPELIETMTHVIYSEATIEKFGPYLISSIGAVSEEELEKFAILARSVREFDCLDQLSRVSCEALIVAAEGDRVFSSESSRLIAEALHGELCLYGPEYGHAVYDEAPDFQEKMLAFFRK